MTMYFSGPYKLCALILHERKINEIDFILSLLDLWLFLDLNSYIPFLGCVYECFQLFLIMLTINRYIGFLDDVKILSI